MTRFMFVASTLYCVSLCPPHPQCCFEEGLSENRSSYILQMIPHFLVLDVGVKICQAQLCSYIRGCHATFLVKNTLFKRKVAWQPLKELQICSSSILNPSTRAFKWSIVCLSTIITFDLMSDYVKKCWFHIVKVDISGHNHLLLQKIW